MTSSVCASTIVFVHVYVVAAKAGTQSTQDSRMKDGLDAGLRRNDDLTNEPLVRNLQRQIRSLLVPLVGNLPKVRVREG